MDLEISDIKLSKKAKTAHLIQKVEELLSQKKEDLAIMRHDLREHFNYIKYELDADVLCTSVNTKDQTQIVKQKQYAK